ncbi:hypothetical protein DY000_02010125 [Brassica cretica]|uniref:Uncharacterized protein n=1 Tax=Brassica cretica TaxID=69181 RepID=A0ABQ7C2Z4_BRACR|nr:hypothetical protein DY000_02010125 [Brassica cretica]
MEQIISSCNTRRPAHHQRVTNEFYDIAGGVKNRSSRSTDSILDHRSTLTSHHQSTDVQSLEKELMTLMALEDSIGRRMMKHASSFTQTKLVPEIYTKNEINEMFYGVCGAQKKNEGEVQIQLDGIYYPLNDIISWLTTCMEEMRQDIARIQTQRAAEATAPASIDRHLPSSIDDNPPHSNPMKSQPDSYTRAEIDQLVEEIYRTLETTEEMLKRRCDNIYFPMDLTMSSLTSQIESI